MKQISIFFTIKLAILMKIKSVVVLVFWLDVHHHISFLPSHSSQIFAVNFLLVFLLITHHIITSNDPFWTSIRILLVWVVIVGVILVVWIEIVSFEVFFIHLFILEADLTEEVLLSEVDLGAGGVEGHFFPD